MILPKSERDCCRVSAPRLNESETIDSAAVVAVGWSNSETKGLKRIDLKLSKWLFVMLWLACLAGF